MKKELERLDKKIDQALEGLSDQDRKKYLNEALRAFEKKLENAKKASVQPASEGAMLKVAAADANSVLTFLDKLGNAVQKDPRRFGLTPVGARVAMTYIDSAADDFEKKTFGEESFAIRASQEMRRQGEDMQTEPDEPYMGTFDNPQAPIQTEPDEPFMGEFNTDTTGEVRQQYPSGTFQPRQSSSPNPFN